MKKLCLAFAAMLPLTAFAYPTELNKQLNGAEVSATIEDIDSDIGSVLLYNYGQVDATCSAVFRSGPEAPRTRKTEVSAGESTNLTQKFGRKIIKLRVDLTCKPL